MALECPQCGAEIPTENINIQEMVALCSDCGLVFNFKDRIPRRKMKQHALPLPKNVRVEESDEQLSIAYQMAYSGAPMFGFIMSMITAILLPVAIIAILTTKNNVETMPMILLGAATLWSWYLVAAFITTTTRITVDDDALMVKTGPLPLPITDDKVIIPETITRVYREEVTDPFPSNNVRAELDNGDKLKVVTTLPEEHAMYIARKIDYYLNSQTPDDVISSDEMLRLDEEYQHDDDVYYDEEREANDNVRERG